MDFRAQILKVGVAVVMLGLGQSAMAATCLVSNVTFRGSQADDCTNAVGGGPGGNILSTELDAAFPNTGTNTGLFQLLVKDNTVEGEAPPASTTGTAFGINWELSADALVSGNFLLKWTAATSGALPVALDIVFGLKGGSAEGAAYLFEQEEFLISPNQGAGVFTITFLNNSGNNSPALSNLTAWGRNPNTNCCREDVPEPGTLALLGLGLLGLGLSRRRVRLSN